MSDTIPVMGRFWRVFRFQAH